MNDDETKLLTIINRLLASYPAGQSGSASDVIDGYMIGLSGIPVEYVAAAAADFLGGKVEGHNKAFAPSPSELAEKARARWHHDIDLKTRERQSAEMIEHRPEPLSEAEIEKRKAFVDEQISKLKVTPDREAELSKARMKDMLTRQSADHLDPRPIEERLNLTTPNTTGETR